MHILQPWRRGWSDVDSLDDLVQDITSRGLLAPPAAVAVEGGYLLLAGLRRWAATNVIRLRDERSRQSAEVCVITNWVDFTTWLRYDAETTALLNSQVPGVCQPLTWMDIYHFYENVRQVLPPHPGDKAEKTVAEYLGVHSGALRRMRYIVRHRDSGKSSPLFQERATELIKRLELGEITPHSAYSHLQDLIHYRPPPGAGDKQVTHADGQRHIITTAIAQLSGINQGLGLVGVPATDLSRAEIIEWLRGLRVARAQIGQIVSLLRETVQQRDREDRREDKQEETP